MANNMTLTADDTQYHSISSSIDNEQHVRDKDSDYEADDLEPRVKLGDHSQVQVKRSWLRIVLFQTLSLLWTAPILALLILNLEKHIIGASAWCPEHNCWLHGYGTNTPVPVSRISKFDHENHDLLGALQFVAKALEIWFELIATALAYLVTMLLAGKKAGLPIGYLTRPSEFAEVTGLLDRLLWTTLPQ